MSEPILIEDNDGLNVVTTLEEARKQIELLNADKNILRKQALAYKEEHNKVFNELTVVREAFNEAVDEFRRVVNETFDAFFETRRQR